MENVSCDYCCCDDYNIICKQKDIVTKTSEIISKLLGVKIADYIIQILGLTKN